MEEEAEEDEPPLFLEEDRLKLDDWRIIGSEEMLFSFPEIDIDWFEGVTLLRLESLAGRLKLPMA